MRRSLRHVSFCEHGVVWVTDEHKRIYGLGEAVTMWRYVKIYSHGSVMGG